MTHPTGHLRVTDTRGVRTIVIDRPRARNALDREMRSQLCENVIVADQDSGTRCVILTGADPTFTAGVDFKDIDPTFDPFRARFSPNPASVLRGVRTPVICAVNGPCISGGLEIALSCSFIVASERAAFADTHARLNAVPAWGLTALLPRAIGIRKAREMSATGNLIDAKEAHGIGLVNHVVRHSDLLGFCHDLAAQMVSTPAVDEILTLYDRGAGLDLNAALHLEADHTSRRRLDPDEFARAGRKAAARNRATRGRDE